VIAVSVVSGWGLGRSVAWEAAAPAAAALSNLALCGLLFVIGYDLGKDRTWRKLREYGAVSLTLPLAVGVASLAGAAAAGFLLDLPLGRSLAAGSGFGWYSMAGAAALEQAGAEIGAYVFMSNLFREVLTVLVVPLLSRRATPVIGAAMGGATAMDSTLPVITRSFGSEGAAWGLVTGTTLTLCSPFVLSLFLRLPL
jgi:uncharacterized membrane protein YbjE (DUF340 family)